LADGANFAVAVDAKRGKLYFGLFDAQGHHLEGPLLLSAEEALHKMPAATTCVLGSGAAMLGETAQAAGRPLDARAASLQPDAAALAQLALAADAPVSNLKPLYLRRPDAKPQTGAAVERL
jgi:tRNA threonylcarbamoyladenosine biosynthesis protein TsaB